MWFCLPPVIVYVKKHNICTINPLLNNDSICVEQGTSLAVIRRQRPHYFWNQKVYKRSTLEIILSQINSATSPHPISLKLIYYCHPIYAQNFPIFFSPDFPTNICYATHTWHVAHTNNPSLFHQPWNGICCREPETSSIPLLFLFCRCSNYFFLHIAVGILSYCYFLRVRFHIPFHTKDM